MRRGSIIGPLILIGIGVLFLARNVWPQIPLLDFLSRYWPLLLIGWGVIRLIEILVWAVQAKPLPRKGISGGEWLLVVLICLFGASMTAAQHANWTFGLDRMLQRHQFPLAPVARPCPKNCQVLIEDFRGNARILGTSDSVVRVAGRETVLFFRQPDADQASKQMPLELIQQGNEIIVRTNQGQGRGAPPLFADLDISVPSDSAIEAHGRSGHLNIVNVNGAVTVEDPRISLRCASLPGEVRITGGDFTANNIGGPVVLNGRSQDVRISGFTKSLELTLNRGDIDLKPGISVPRMEVHTRSGDIDLWLPADAKFDLRASTERGEVHNDYGEPLVVNSSGRGATIVGAVPGGPQLRLETGRGSVTVRKSTSDETTSSDSPRLPTSSDQPLHVERQ